MAGSAQIGNLQVRMGIDTAQFSAGVKKAQGSLSGLTSSLKAFAAGAAGALSLGAVVSTLRTAATRMDELGKAAQKIGIPVAELSKLEYAARLADVSLEDLTAGTAKFSKSLAEIAAGGQNSASAALDALGISAVDSNGKLRPTIEIYGDIADRFQKMQDGAGKTAIALALIPKSGAGLIPLFNGGRDAIKAAGDELERFGGTVGPEAAKRAEAFNDNLTRLKTASEGLSQTLAEALLPAAIEITEALIEWAKTGDGLKQWGEKLTDMLSGVGGFIEGFKTEIEDVMRLLRALGLVAASTPKLQSDFDAIWRSGNGPQTPAGGKGDMQYPRAPAPELNLGNGGSRRRTRTTTDTNGLTAYDREDWKVSAETFASEIDVAQDAVNSLADTVTATLGNALAGLADGTMSLKDAFESMSRRLMSELSSLIAMLAKSGLMQLLGSAGAKFAPQTGIAGFGGFYAEGGTLGAGKWGIAGENGPEIVKGPASISPMGGGSTQVNIYNQGGGQVEQRKRRGSGGQDIVDVYIRGVARDEALKTQRKSLPGVYGTPAALTQR